MIRAYPLAQAHNVNLVSVNVDTDRGEIGRRILLIGTVSGGSKRVAGVTFEGDSIPVISSASDGSTFKVNWHAVPNPVALESASIQATWGGDPVPYAAIHVFLLDGVLEGAPDDFDGNTVAAGLSVSTTVTPVADESIVAGIMVTNASNPVMPNKGFARKLPGAAWGWRSCASTKRCRKVTGSVTHTYTAEHGVPVDIGLLTVAYSPAVAPVDPTFPDVFDVDALIDEYGTAIQVYSPSATGTIENGVYDPVSSEPSPVLMAVHPSGTREIMRLPERDRTKDAIQCYTRAALVEGRSLVEYRGRRYKVMLNADYALQAGSNIYTAVAES